MKCLDRSMRSRYRDRRRESRHAVRLWRRRLRPLAAALAARRPVSDSGRLFDSDHGASAAARDARSGEWQISCCRIGRPFACNLRSRRIIRSRCPI
jgi:hypothetical protein